MEHFLYDTHTILSINAHFFNSLYDSLGGPFRSIWIWSQISSSKAEDDSR